MTTATSPSPDLVPLEPPRELVDALRVRGAGVAGGADPPHRAGARPRARDSVLVTGGLDRLWDETVAAGADGVAAANVIANTLVGAGVDPDAAPASELAKLVEARERIPRGAFDQAIAKLADPGFTADPYLAQEAVSDTGELGPIVDRVLEANPGQVAAYRGGKEGLLGFFVGQVMKETQGPVSVSRRSRICKADPRSRRSRQAPRLRRCGRGDGREPRLGESTTWRFRETKYCTSRGSRGWR